MGKTNGFIISGVMMACISIEAYGQLSSRITDFAYTPCAELFYTKDTIWMAEVLHNNSLSLKFTYEMPCSAYLYPEILVATPDSLVMKILPGNKKWVRDSKEPSKTVSVSEDYRGYYTFHLELSGISKIPKEVSINNKYHHSYFGFIDSDFYNTVKNKNFHNDSKSISYERLLELLGKSTRESHYKDFSRSLGGDYVEYDDAYSFVEDHISITYNSKGIIEEVEVGTAYQGTLPGNIVLSSPIGKVVELIGSPDSKLPNNAILLNDNGEKIIFHESDTYYYKKYKLSLRVNQDGNVNSCSFK